MLFNRIITVGLNPTIDRLIEVPNLQVGEHFKGRLRSRQPAGKAFNVSRALAGVGVTSRAMGFLGSDSVELFDHAARLHNIETKWTTIEARTRENITLLDPIHGTSTHIRDAGATVTPADIARITSDLEQVCNPETLLAFCGSLPPGLTADHFGQLLDACTARGAQLAVDTSGDALKRAAQSKLWLIKPNAEECAELLNRPLTTEQDFLDAGATLGERFPCVLITHGSKGAYLFESNQTWKARLQLPSEMIRSTVGCGDTFLAGFLAARHNNAPAPDALRSATALAAASALSDMPASFSLADYEQFSSDVQLTALT